VCAVDVLGDGLDALFTSGGIGITWVEVVILDAERLAARQVINEGVVSLLLANRIRMGQVDKIRSMRKAARGCINIVSFTALEEGSCKGVVERRIVPLALVLEEQGECISTAAN
jgi:hypothetical protein